MTKLVFQVVLFHLWSKPQFYSTNWFHIVLFVCDIFLTESWCPQKIGFEDLGQWFGIVVIGQHFSLNLFPFILSSVTGAPTLILSILSSSTEGAGWKADMNLFKTKKKMETKLRMFS